jgi:two-component system sensor histidine kinase AlgZ
MSTTPTPDTSFFLPDFCAVRLVFAVVIISELLAIIITLAPMDSRSHFWGDLSIISLFVQWVGLSSAGLLCALRPWLSRQSEKMAASLSYLLLLLTTLVLTEAAFWIGQQTSFSGIDLSQWRLNGWHGYLLLHNLGISAIVSALVLRYFYIQHQWQQNMRAEALARVQALQSRIRPHFLFNSLNTIASLTQIDPNQAEAAVEDLADLFRNSLADAGHHTSLKDELRLSQRYLDIEALRLGQRLKLRWCVDELPLDAQVPRLLIQPLLENAIYHGIEPLAEGGTIGIDGHLYGDEIYITISNPLPQQQGEKERQGNRVAQENVRQRLAAIYGENGKLTVQADKDDYLTTISLPYIKQEITPEEKKA